MRELLIALLAFGCGSSVEPLAPEPNVPTVGAEGGARWSASSALEQRVRRLYDACEARRAALQQDVGEGYGGDAAMTTLALGAAVAASGASGTNLGANASMNEETLSPGTRVRDNRLPQDPARPSEGRRARQSADAEIALINEGLADLDAWLGANPDPRSWDDERRDTFERQHDDLSARCR